MGSSLSYAQLSFWHETCGDPLEPRPALDGSHDVDVAIVGAGFTGLWTAYYLTLADPRLRIVVLDKDVAGFGASGRNGGWVSDLFPSSREHLATLPGSSREAAVAQTLAMRDTVDEIGRVAEQEGISCGFHKGGSLSFARNRAQAGRARGMIEESRRWGDDDRDLRWLEPAELQTHAHVTRALGATFTPHCARVHPARLVRGLAAAVERRGVRIYEQTDVSGIAPHRVTTDRGVVRADVIVRATEGFTPRLKGLRRDVVPVYSLAVATEPLSADTWDEIGLEGRPTFTDHRNMIIYGQRSMDDRLVFGGRGAPYHFGSSVAASHDREDRVFSLLQATLRDLFPVLDDVAFTHAWGGPIGITRDWMASVGLHRRSGVAWAGGYVGDGVSTTNLAGRTLTDLIIGTRSLLTRLPWVNHRSPRWEPEPVRWLGINAGLRAMTVADVEERLTHQQSVLAHVMRSLTGGH